MKIFASRYQLGPEIGTGGEARVFRARDVTLGQDVAIRFARRPDAPAAARTPAHPHPGWVRLLHAGVDEEGKFYQVFELLSGPTLSTLVAPAPLPGGAWRDFVRQSLDAVEALHAAGWIHGDLNADNFLFHDGRTWKLLELPFDRLAPPEGRSAIFGSIFTLAPEQIDGASPGVLTDLYALGCLYYYAATGRFPHAADGTAQIAVERLRFPPAPLQARALGLTAREEAFVLRLLERRPQDRPADLGAARRLLGEDFPPITPRASSG